MIAREMAGAAPAEDTVTPGASSGATYPSPFAALRTGVLQAMRGPAFRAPGEIPHREEVLNAQLAGAVRTLWREGKLERVPDPRTAGTGWAYRATPSGRLELEAALEAFDYDC